MGRTRGMRLYCKRKPAGLYVSIWCFSIVNYILLLHTLPILVYDVERPASLVFPAFLCQKKVSKQGWQNNLRKTCKAWIIKGPQILTKVQKEPIYLLNVSLIICPAQNFEFLTAVWPMNVLWGFPIMNALKISVFLNKMILEIISENLLDYSIWYLTNKFELKRFETAKRS